jgi:hypothetical protein
MTPPLQVRSAVALEESKEGADDAKQDSPMPKDILVLVWVGWTSSVGLLYAGGGQRHHHRILDPRS